MKKKLVYHFFFYKDWRENPIYKLHFNCLNYYKDRFDEVYFALSFEDKDDTESVKEVEKKISAIFNSAKRVRFEVVGNSELCECVTFKKEVVDTLGEDDLVFFAHSKGVMDIKKGRDYTDLCRLICAMYFYSLNYRKEYEDTLLMEPLQISYGSLMVQYTYEPHVNSKYEWHYACTYYWINSKRLKQYLTINNIETPIMCDRFYAENFLSNIYPIHTENTSFLACSHAQHYTIANYANYPDYDLAIDYSAENDEEKEDFKRFIEEMTKYN